MRTVGLIVAIIGLLVGALGALQMTSLASVSGDTVAEAFYNQMGYVLLGMVAVLFGNILIALAVPKATSFIGKPAACPSCRQEISDQASVCPYCNQSLRPASPEWTP